MKVTVRELRRVFKLGSASKWLIKSERDIFFTASHIAYMLMLGKR